MKHTVNKICAETTLNKATLINGRDKKLIKYSKVTQHQKRC